MTPGPPEAAPSMWREAGMALLALASILIGISQLGNPRGPPAWIQAVDVLIAVAFLLEWAARVRAAAPGWGRYALTHAYEVLFFIPFTLLPGEASAGNLVRGARLLRFLRFARYGRYAKLGLGFTRLPRRLRHLGLVARNAQLATIFFVGALTVSVGGAALLAFEGDAAGVRTYPEAWWWSLSLFTTVAYAVPEPVTPAGHVVSALLMVAGVAYVGVFTASLAGAILRTPPEAD